MICHYLLVECFLLITTYAAAHATKIPPATYNNVVPMPPVEGNVEPFWLTTLVVTVPVSWIAVNLVVLSLSTENDVNFGSSLVSSCPAVIVNTISSAVLYPSGVFDSWIL